jgi:uncharacterized protein YoxC
LPGICDIIFEEVRMNTILLGVIAFSILAIAAYLVPLLIELKKTVVSIRKTTECNLNPALDELQHVLKNVQDISENISDVTTDVKQFSKSISDLGQKVSAVNVLIGGIGATTAIRAVSLKTGVRAAIEYFISNLTKKGDRK